MLFGVSDYHILSSAHQYAAYTATIDQMCVCNVTAVACYGRSIDGYHPTLVIISCEPLIVFQLCLDFSIHSFSLAVQSRVSEFFFLFQQPSRRIQMCCITLTSHICDLTYHLRGEGGRRWSYRREGCQAGDRSSRLCFILTRDIFKWPLRMSPVVFVTKTIMVWVFVSLTSCFIL